MNKTTIISIIKKITQLLKLHEAIAATVLTHEVGPVKLPSKKDKNTVFSLGSDAREIAGNSEADYALFIYLQDSYTSAGRAAMMMLAGALGVGLTGGSQIGFTSLVDLNTGDIKWFNRLYSSTGDVRDQVAAGKTVAAFLKGMPES